MRIIAKQNNVEYSEVLKIWRNQFLCAKEELGKYTSEELATMSEEEQEKIVVNFLYLGKIHMNNRTQRVGNRKNKLGEYEDTENEEDSKDN